MEEEKKDDIKDIPNDENSENKDISPVSRRTISSPRFSDAISVIILA